jgi:NADPH-dependent curcumin reductase CurA
MPQQPRRSCSTTARKAKRPQPPTSSWSPPRPPPLKDGEVLVRNHYLSLDPYMRGRMNDSKSYAASRSRWAR